MTTPKPPLPPVTNKAKKPGTSTPWYRASIVWIGIGLSLLILGGYGSLLYISHSYAPEKPTFIKKDSEQLNELLGMPFSRDQIQRRDASQPTSTTP